MVEQPFPIGWRLVPGAVEEIAHEPSIPAIDRQTRKRINKALRPPHPKIQDDDTNWGDLDPAQERGIE